MHPSTYQARTLPAMSYSKVDAILGPWRIGIIGGYIPPRSKEMVERGQTSVNGVSLADVSTSLDVQSDRRSIPLLYRYGQIPALKLQLYNIP